MLGYKYTCHGCTEYMFDVKRRTSPVCKVRISAGVTSYISPTLAKNVKVKSPKVKLFSTT